MHSAGSAGDHGREGDMCLGIPMKVINLNGDDGVVEAGRLKRTANFSLLKIAKKGDYVIIHAGFAIERVKEKEAKKTLKALKGIV